MLSVTLGREQVDVNVTPDKRLLFVQNEKYLLACVKVRARVWGFGKQLALRTYSIIFTQQEEEILFVENSSHDALCFRIANFNIVRNFRCLLALSLHSCH